MARRMSRGFARQQRRKFVWDRQQGVLGTPGTTGVDLLAAYRAQPGATHVGATVMRIRGYVYPDTDAAAPAFLAGVIGFRIDSWNESATDITNAPTAMPDEDWMGWLPFFREASTVSDEPIATWNSQANAWAVDIKSNRKLEELNQTLWMFVTSPATGTTTYNYNLSVGLKLP